MKRILTLFILLCLIGCSTNKEPQQEITKPTEFNTVDNLITLKSKDITINTDEEFNIDDYIKKTEGTTVMSSLDKDKKILSITAINGTNKQELNVPVKLESIYPIVCKIHNPSQQIVHGKTIYEFISDKKVIDYPSGDSRTYEYYIKDNFIHLVYSNGEEEMIGYIIDNDKKIIQGLNNRDEPMFDDDYSICDKEIPW